MNGMESGSFDDELAELDAALPPLLRAETSDPRWPRRLRRRLRRERWAQRLEVLALLLQVVLLAGLAALFHPWRWNWTAGGYGLVLSALLLAVVFAAVGATACWSVNSIGGARR